MATIAKQTIYLNLRPGAVMPVLHVSQGDSGLESLEFKLINGHQPWTIPAAVTDIQLNGATPVGVFSYNDPTWSGNTVTANVTETMTAEKGVVICELRLLDSTLNSIGTLNFVISVEPSPYTNAHVSTSDMATIIAALNGSQQNMLLSKSWAVGNTGVRSGENTNNSKYWSEVSDDNGQRWAIGSVDGTAVPSTDPAYHNNSKWWSSISESWAIGGTGDRAGEDTNNSKYWSTVSHMYANEVSYKKVYENVAEMKADADLLDGQICRTLGYYTADDGGGALYQMHVEQPTTYSEIIENGLYAELIFPGVVTLEMFGAKGDGITDDSTVFSNAVSNTDSIYVLPKTYKLNSNIVLRSMSGKKIYGVRGKSVIRFDQRAITPAAENFNYLLSFIACADIEINGIVFDYAPTGSNSYNNVLVNIDECSRISFKDCALYSDKDNGGMHNICTCAFIRSSNGLTTIANKSITFEECDIINHSGATEGGCVWVVSPMTHVSVNKCHVSHCTSDEALASWNTSGGIFTINDSYMELVNLNITPSQIIGAYRTGIIAVNNSKIYSPPGLGALSFIRSHHNGTIMLNNCDVSVDMYRQMRIFKTQADESIIQLSNCRIYAPSSIASDDPKIYEGVDGNGIFKASNCEFIVDRAISSQNTPLTVMSSTGGHVTLSACSFKLVNPDKYQYIGFYFTSAKTNWAATGCDFIGSGGQVQCIGIANVSSAAAGNNRNANITFNSNAQTMFA